MDFFLLDKFLSSTLYNGDNSRTIEIEVHY